jgi:TatD DNase family protein
MWIDTHCHLDALEFGSAADAAHPVRALVRQCGVTACVLPAVAPDNFDAVRTLAHALGDAYALGLHPLWLSDPPEAALARLAAALQAQSDDPRLVAVGEIGLDFFVPAACTPAARARQLVVYRAQLRLAWQHGLPVLLHVRRSADALLQGLREAARQGRPVPGGIAHAFNGSLAQARAFIDLGFKLGFGGAVTFGTALRLRRLVTELPLEALVLETDAPDMPPHWRYVTAAQRAAGQPQACNSPAELPRIGALVAALRGLTPQALALATTRNAQVALPRLTRAMA